LFSEGIEIKINKNLKGLCKLCKVLPKGINEVNPPLSAKLA
jgi:hypothetical protein